MFVLQTVLLFGQAPQKMSYQAVIRNGDNEIIVDQKIGIRLSVLQGSGTGTAVYVETQQPTTNTNGLVSLEIGGGTIESGKFEEINWASGSHYIKTEIDPLGGTDYTLSGAYQLLSVPYALYAVTSGSGQAGTLSTVLTSAATELSYRDVTLNGAITNSGGRVILAKGFCINIAPNPTELNAVLVTGNNPGYYSHTATGLLPDTTYYVRAFATSTAGTAYGPEISFKTLALTQPTVVTGNVSNVSSTYAAATGTITENGGSVITDRGFCWATTQNPTTVNNKISLETTTSDFIASIKGLSPNTTYYLRAYAINAQGTSYGESETFTTITISLPTLADATANAASYTSVSVSSQVLTDGGDIVTQRGICYGTQTNPTLANTVISSGGGIGVFTVNITGLTPNTVYYARAFATNLGGTAYGTEVSFTTLETTLPTVTTTEAFGIETTKASSGGTVTTDGGSTVTQRGICYGTQENPTLQNSYTVNGTGAGDFNSNMTGLTLGTVYYVRAYATNAVGTAYGPQVTFTTTLTLPTSITDPIIGTKFVTKNFTDYSCGGFISNTGGNTIIRQGICFKKPEYTYDNNWNNIPVLPIVGISSTVVNSTYTGLGKYDVDFSLPNTCQEEYWVRAFVETNAGITYGELRNVYTGLTGTFTTTPATEITGTTASSGGTIIQDGGCDVIERGVCWSKNQNPTTANYKASSGTGTGSYSTNMTNLIPNTTYYMRSYLVNATGTLYGDQQTFSTVGATGRYIGESYAGGIIFYLDATGNHGLVCATQDQGSAAWGCEGTLIYTSKAVGAGAQNTAAIVAGCNETNTAAKICDNLALNTYNDWYLPSIDELGLMYSNLYINGLGNLSGSYTSSSEAGYDQTQTSNNYYFKGFYSWSNYTSDTNKNNGQNIRAIRSF